MQCVSHRKFFEVECRIVLQRYDHVMFCYWAICPVPSPTPKITAAGETGGWQTQY